MGQGKAESSKVESAGATVRPVALLLEDDVPSAEGLIQLLDHYEWDVRHARTLLEAMPLLPLVPAVAILDLMMPDGGGDRVLDLIRKRKLPTKVVIMTGCRERERLQEVARLKPDLILTKPINFFRLLDFMRAAQAVEE